MDRLKALLQREAQMLALVGQVSAEVQEIQRRMREEQKDHQIEREGKELRSMMDWIDTEF